MKSIYVFAVKIRFVRIRVMVSLLGVLCVLCGQIFAQDFKTVDDGVEYAEVTREIRGLKVNINLLRLDLTKVRLDVHHAMDAAIGTEKASSIATRKGAVAAINAGFFRLDNSSFLGDPAGVLMINGELLSESSNNRISLQIINKKKQTETFIDRFNVSAWLGSRDSLFQIKLSGVNRERKENELILYSRDFGPATPSVSGSTDLVLGNCQRQKKIALIVCTDVSIRDDAANTPIPVGGYVISVSPGDFRDKQLLLKELKLFQAVANKKKSLFLQFEKQGTPTLFDEEDIVAGVPQLIKDGKIDITWEQEKTTKSFVETRHPRTAVAKLKDGKFLMITVDGRSESSGGISLYDLAAYLLELGAVDAMNLDGGGSTTMFLDGKVVNHPSDKEGERKVSDAILVTLRKK